MPLPAELAGVEKRLGPNRALAGVDLTLHEGEVLALLPLPANDVTVESVDRSGAGFNVAIRLHGETDETVIQTRWKDRDGRPTMVEASHQSRTERVEPAIEEDGATLDVGPS